MRCLAGFLLFILIALGGTTVPSAAAEWKSYNAGGLSFQLPREWTKRVTETPVSPDGPIFSTEVPNQGTLRIFVLPGTGETPKPRKNTEDVMSTSSWRDLVESVQAAGYELLEGGAGRSRQVDGVMHDSMVVATTHNGVKKGFRLAVWSTPAKRIRAELTYTRRMSRDAFAAIIDLWSGMRYDRAGSAPSVAAIAGLQSPGNAAGTATAAPPVAPRAKPRTIAELVQDFRDSLVFIEGGNGSGSGFICKTPDGTFLYTNQHVVAGMARLACTRLDGGAVKIGAATAAVGHDEMRFVTDAPALAFEAGAQIESFSKIGDEIVVLGNSEGSRVIAPLRGKLVGIGPDRIEVDAQFVPGNSGSPIVHVPSGKVIGIATYLTLRRYTELTDKKEPAIRRFGYRLDSVKQWQPVNWAAFQNEHAELEKIASLSRDFAHLLEDMAKDGRLDAKQHADSGLARIVGELDRAIGRQAMSAPDRLRVLQNFLGSLRSATQADLAAARGRLRYDFFIRLLKEETAMRDELHQLFDRAAKAAAR